MEEELNHQEAPVEAPQNPPQEAPQEAPKEPVPALEVDERTGRRRVVMKGPEPPKEEPPQEEPPKEPPKEEPPQEEPTKQEPPHAPTAILNQFAPKPVYKPDEMVLAMQLGNVDESRIPPELKAQYEAVKPKAPTKEDAEREIREKIQSMAKAEAMKKSGATEEDLKLGEFSDDEEVQKRVQDYKTAYELAQQQIIRDSLDRYRAMRAAETKRMEVMQNVKNFIDEQRAKEPNFDAIGKRMETKFLEMPFQQAAVIEPVLKAAMAGNLTDAQAKVLGDYYELCRKDVYAKINNTSVTPQPVIPKVEGKGAGLSAETHPDYAKLLREAGMRDKPRIIASWLAAQKEK